MSQKGNCSENVGASQRHMHQNISISQISPLYLSLDSVDTKMQVSLSPMSGFIYIHTTLVVSTYLKQEFHLQWLV
jgi:hypothetical protein